MNTTEQRSIVKVFKIVILSFFLLSMVININLTSACVQPPDTNMINPVVLPDGTGRFYVAWQNNEGKGPFTSLAGISIDGMILWQKQIDLSQPFKSNIASPTELVSDGEGNVFVVWGMGDNVWIQKYDSNGNSIWKNKIKVFSCKKLEKMAAISDSQDGAIIGAYGQLGEFRLQRVNKEGKPVWLPEISMSDNGGFNVTLDSSGDILLFYATVNRSFYLQKLDLAKSKIWDIPIHLNTQTSGSQTNISSGKITPIKSTGLLGCGSGSTVYPYRADPGEYATWLINDQSGGCIIGYSDTFGHSLPERSMNLYRVNINGNILWEKHIGAKSDDDHTMDFATSRVVSDNMGGLFVVSSPMPQIPKANNAIVIVRHIDYSGNELLGTGEGMIVAANVWNVDSYDVISDGSKLVIGWTSEVKGDYSPTKEYRVQEVDFQGKKLWGENGTLLFTTGFIPTMAPALYPDGSGGFVISLGRIGGRISMMWRIDSAGKVLWERRFPIE
jgi:hypothetical protein